MEHKLAIDVTVSGSLKSGYRLPNGNIKYFVDKSDVPYDVWKTASPRKFKLNALNIETFSERKYPMVDISVKKKDISKFAEFFYKDLFDEKVYDVTIKPVGEKTVTEVRTSSGSVFYFDEGVSVFENALNGIIKN